MKITMFSNFLNHHQKDLCEALYAQLGGDFRFVATSPVPQERLSMGYHDMNKLQIPYLLTAYDDEETKQRSMELALNSDVMIWGSAPPVYYLERVKQDKLTFVYSERIWKNGVKELKNIRKIASYFYHHTRFRHKNVYLLCSSAFTASDFAKVGAYKGKAFKWGYFPSLKVYPSVEALQEKKTPSTILWAGRFIHLKRPLQAIQAVKLLAEWGIHFHMKMIGSGELEWVMRSAIREYGLEDHISICGIMTPEQIRAEMESSSVYIFTSDYGEGWGAVLNEAMNSACGVVVSSAVGAAAFLVRNNENGIVYDYQDTAALAHGIETLLKNKERCMEYGANAYKTITDMWNGVEAAKRLIRLSEVLQSDPASAGSLYSEGPCSRSPVRKKM